MKTKLLFTKKINTLYSVLALLLCVNVGMAQTNLVLNGTADDLTSDTNDNADAWDMTPPSSVKDAGGADIDSPYRALWYNSDLDTWLAENCGDSDEQPGSSSDGNFVDGEKTRGVKLSEKCRRLYQVVAVTAGTEYAFSIESRSEAENVPSEVFILNTEIVSEDGLNSESDSVDAYFNITNDYNKDKSTAEVNNFTTNSFTFTASQTKVVIYVRSSGAIDGSTEVFYDNISLIETSTLSTNLLESSLNIYPNPVKDFVTIEASDVTVTSVEVYNVVGQKLLSTTKLNNNKLNVSKLNSGVYLLKINADGKTLVKKIIKE